MLLPHWGVELAIQRDLVIAFAWRCVYVVVSHRQLKNNPFPLPPQPPTLSRISKTPKRGSLAKSTDGYYMRCCSVFRLYLSIYYIRKAIYFRSLIKTRQICPSESRGVHQKRKTHRSSQNRSFCHSSFVTSIRQQRLCISNKYETVF